MKRMLVLLFAATGLLVAAGPASAATAWKGVVVAKDAKRGTVVTASAGGVVRTVRSAQTFKLGQRLDVRGTALADGTFNAVSVKATGRAKTARVRAAVVRWQQAQQRLLVSAGGSTFALSRKATRTLSSSTEHAPRPGDKIAATVTFTTAMPQATSVSIVGRIGVLEVEGILTKIEAGSIELVVARTGFVTLALPAGFALPAGLAQFDAVRVHVAVGTDGKLTLLSIGDDRNNRDDDRADDDEDEVEVTGKITALSDTSITVTPGSSAPVTCALSKPLTGFAVGDLVEVECASGTAGALKLVEIKHEDNDDNDDEEDDDDDDHSGHGKGGGEDH